MQPQTIVPMWNVQIYNQGDLISSEIIEESEVHLMTQHFERTCYEVRSELAWTPVIPLASPATLEPVEAQQATLFLSLLGVYPSITRTPSLGWDLRRQHTHLKPTHTTGWQPWLWST